MRLVILVVVVAAHVFAFLLFPSWRRPLGQEREEEVVVEPIFLTSRVPEATQDLPARQAPLLYGSAPGKKGVGWRALQRPRASAPSLPSTAGPDRTSEPSHAPDWHAQAESIASENASRIVAAEADAERRAKALTSKFKPLPLPRVRQREFGWDYAPTHRLAPIPGGGFAIAINDNCQILILPLPFIGCAIGKRTANGDLFMNLHPPVKFGDWDWRVQDP